MSLAIGKVALVALPLLLVALGGGAKDTSNLKAAYDAGYSSGKSDKENGKAESLNPAASLTGINPAEASAYTKGYADGYKAGVTKGTGGGPVTPAKPQTNGKDTETSAQANSRGYAQGLADGRQDGSAGNGYGYTHTKATYTRSDLQGAYESSWNSAYAKGYAEGVKHKEDGGGTIMGDVLGTQGDSSAFKPMRSASHYYNQRRPSGYPTSWYNY
jgi:hypothetical protein